MRVEPSKLPDDLVSSVAEAAFEAGKTIMGFFQKACSHQLKADRSPVTEADYASHNFLVTALGRLTPELSVISEESAETEATRTSPSDYWLIDPLDGTKEFLKGKPEFTVNVALMRAHHPVLGVVHAPALGLTYLGRAGKGAWRQEGRQAAIPIQTKSADLARLTVVASKDHSGPRVKRMLARLGAPELTSIGSSLKFCLVAEGRADLYFRDLPTMEWDTAAAHSVVEAAGGMVVDTNGEPLRYGKPGLKNSAFVAVGDPAFPWGELLSPAAPGRQERAFRAFFTEISREAGQS